MFTFLEALGNTFLERHEQDTTFMRLLLFSALEGHELSDMFLSSMPERDPVAAYIQRRIDEGAFRDVDPNLAARAFVGMFFMFIRKSGRRFFGLKKNELSSGREVVRTFVSTFLGGIRQT